ncbi:patatin-like phospholipase family protein [Sunxiuqinia elliptica]
MKLHNLILTAGLVIISQFYVHAQEPKVALVLSGGGAKGFAHIGVLKVLEEEGLPISIIVGNSIGSIIGGVAATGYSAKEIELMAKSQNWDELLFDYVSRKYKSDNLKTAEQRYFLELPLNKDTEELELPSGVVSGQNVLNLFCKFMANVPDSVDFRKLPISFACIGTNLETGQEEVLMHGFLPKAVLASMAIPGMFSPVNFNGLYLVDGGIVNNYPSDVAQMMGADIIIGVDLQTKPLAKEQLNSADKIFGQIASFTDLEKGKCNRAIVDLNIKPNMEGYNMSSFTQEAVDTLIIRGEKAARQKITEIRELISKHNLEYQAVDRKYVEPKKYRIEQISLDNKLKIKEPYILDLSNLEVNKLYSASELQNSMYKLYGEGNFAMVYPSLIEKKDKYQLNIHTKLKQSSMLKIGFGANSADGVNLNLNYSFQDFRKLINLFTIDFKASYNPRVIITAETHNYKLPGIGLKIDAQHTEQGLFKLGKEKGKYKIFNANADIYTYKRFKNSSSILQLGLRYDFDSSNFSTENGTIIKEQSDRTQTSRFSAYSSFHFDSFDKYFLPKKGISFHAEFNINEVINSTLKSIPIVYANFEIVAPINNTLAFTGEIYHRAVYRNDYPGGLANYASDKYSAFNNYSLMYAGQYGLSFTDKIATCSKIGLRLKIANKHFLTPQVSILTDMDNWGEMNNADTKWLIGLNYSRMTILGPIDLSFNMPTNDEHLVFQGGIGFQF